jgi:hypothetical protein
MRSRVTLGFFLFAFVHCFALGILQSVIYSADAQTAALTSSILNEARVPRQSFAWLRTSAGMYNLQLCNGTEESRQCETIFESGNNTIGAARTYPEETLTKRSANLTLPAALNSTGNVEGVSLELVGRQSSVVLDSRCIRILVYPDQM